MSAIKKSYQALTKANLIPSLPDNIQKMNDQVYEKVTNSEKDGYLTYVLGLSAEKYENQKLRENFQKKAEEKELGTETVTVYKNGVKIEKEIDKNK